MPRNQNPRNAAPIQHVWQFPQGVQAPPQTRARGALQPTQQGRSRWHPASMQHPQGPPSHNGPAPPGSRLAAPLLPPLPAQPALPIGPTRIIDGSQITFEDERNRTQCSEVSVIEHSRSKDTLQNRPHDLATVVGGWHYGGRPMDPNADPKLHLTVDFFHQGVKLERHHVYPYGMQLTDQLTQAQQMKLSMAAGMVTFEMSERQLVPTVGLMTPVDPYQPVPGMLSIGASPQNGQVAPLGFVSAKDRDLGHLRATRNSSLLIGAASSSNTRQIEAVPLSSGSTMIEQVLIEASATLSARKIEDAPSDPQAEVSDPGVKEHGMTVLLDTAESVTEENFELDLSYVDGPEVLDELEETVEAGETIPETALKDDFELDLSYMDDPVALREVEKAIEIEELDARPLIHGPRPAHPDNTPDGEAEYDVYEHSAAFEESVEEDSKPTTYDRPPMIDAVIADAYKRNGNIYTGWQTRGCWSDSRTASDSDSWYTRVHEKPPSKFSWESSTETNQIRERAAGIEGENDTMEEQQNQPLLPGPEVWTGGEWPGLWKVHPTLGDKEDEATDDEDDVSLLAVGEIEEDLYFEGEDDEDMEAEGEVDGEWKTKVNTGHWAMAS